MSLEIASMREDHLEDAALLVTERYKALRAKVPLMPSRYEARDTILAMLQGLAGSSSGVVAMQGKRIVGFLMGFPLADLVGKRCAYSPEWANGAALEDSRRVYEEMYTHLAPRWVADGCFCHAVSMLGNDREGIEGWQWMGFGMVAIDGVREARPVRGMGPMAEVRQATLGDAREVRDLFRGLARHLAAAPTFWIHEMDDPEEWLAKPGRVLWLAFQEGEAVGCLGMEIGHEGGCEVLQDEETASIEPAFTKEGKRGHGIGAALLNQALQQAEAEGYARCAVDFESMNTLAARFWTRWFEPVCYSLLRVVDERVGEESRM